MTGAEWLAIAAVLMCAAAILPGTLGILMYTNQIAASDSGARYIYGKAMWLGVASAAVMAAAIYQAGPIASLSLVTLGAITAYAGVLVFGFFMHTKLLFRPIKKPQFISLDEAIDKFGPDEEVVGVIDGAGRPWAFVSRLARRPHIIYQPDGDAPFIMTHCILAHSSMSYAMADKFRQPDIAITAALANNMVFYEKTNQCSVIQMHNRSRNEKLQLQTVPTLAVKLSTWQALYPDSRVWMRNIEWRDVFYLKLLARADVIDPASPVMIYPLQHDQDNRLPMKSMVIGVEVGDQTRTYTLPSLAETPVINDELDGTALLVASGIGGDYVQVFDRSVDGEVLSFSQAADGTGLVDDQSGSEWSVTGECIKGPRKGQQLTAVPHYNKIFWYVWSDFHPGTDIYGAVGAEAQSAA